MSKSRAEQLKKVRDELQGKFSEACKKLDATIKAEEDEDDPAKKQAAIDYSGTRLVREVAEKSGDGRKGTAGRNRGRANVGTAWRTAGED